MRIGADRAADWSGRRVLVTGHTGFKGAWLALWLHDMGAHVTGLSDAMPSVPAHAELLRLDELIEDRRGDVADRSVVEAAVAAAQPDAIFHLAAQSLVRPSYRDPLRTFATNVMGTANVLDVAIACRVPAVVVAATDKCYENLEWGYGYRESDPLGGHDPYSASKGAAEIVTSSFRRSFPGATRIASIRAGNVIGPGDWSEDRLLADAVRAATSGTPMIIRNPASTRPWQDVLDCLAGYLVVGAGLLAGAPVDRPWNVGPPAWENAAVGDVVRWFADAWGSDFEFRVEPDGGPHEAGLLALDATAIRAELGWAAVRSVEESLATLTGWHRRVHEGADARGESLAVLAEFAARVPTR